MGGSFSAIKYLANSEPDNAVFARYVIRRTGIITSLMLLVIYGVFLILSYTDGTQSPFYYMMRATTQQLVIMCVLLFLFAMDLVTSVLALNRPVPAVLLSCAMSNMLTVIMYMVKEVLAIIHLEKINSENPGAVAPSTIYINVIVLVLIAGLKGSIAAALLLIWRRVTSGVLILKQEQAMPIVHEYGPRQGQIVAVANP